jgi:hypothetical protein
MLSRRAFLLSTAVAALLPARGRVSGAVPNAGVRTFRPEDFGARGDGRTNDSAAFAALSAAVNQAGAGIIILRKVTYVVGTQKRTDSPESGWLYVPGTLLELKGCPGPLSIQGNGARLRCAPGLRFGTFDPQTGNARSGPMAYTGPGRATPYMAMIAIRNCSGPVEVHDIELDGNLAAHRLGNGYGDTGYQIPCTGLALLENSGSEIVRNVFTHHHALDGLYIDGDTKVPPVLPARLISGLRSEYNGRQGCSIVGGRGYRFERCAFRHTGRAGIGSAPGAGIDIEAEGGKTIRGLTFDQCEFSNNSGCGMVADSGDSASARFTACTFVGTTNWSAWPCKPLFRFDRCTFVGAMVRAYGDPMPARAAQFVDCLFSDDPKRSPTGAIYLPKPNGPIADLADARNMLFDRCRFQLVAKAALPWSTGAIYRDCRMSQRTSEQGYPRGKYLGHSEILGNVGLSGANIVGTLLVNGEPMKHGVLA